MNEDRQNRIAFSPPNISAFKKGEIAKEGTLFHALNENTNANIEA